MAERTAATKVELKESQTVVAKVAQLVECLAGCSVAETAVQRAVYWAAWKAARLADHWAEQMAD